MLCITVIDKIMLRNINSLHYKTFYKMVKQNFTKRKIYPDVRIKCRSSDAQSHKQQNALKYTRV